MQSHVLALLVVDDSRNEEFVVSLRFSRTSHKDATWVSEISGIGIICSMWLKDRLA